MKIVALGLLALPLFAHVVSMSTGEAVLKGSQLDYELRMPSYEVAHVSNAEQTLFDNVRFFGGGDQARLIRHSCRDEAGNYVCNALYLFPRDVDEFTARCTLASVTVPNHVHLLRATFGRLTDQAAFDASFTEAALRFRPPTFGETLAREAGAGFWRAIAGPAQILFLIALLLAARGWRDLGFLFAMFAAGQVAAALLAPRYAPGLAPRFIEAAAALTIAYLAVELLLLPNAGGRWIVVGILGLFHGAYFAMLFVAGNYQPGFFLTGAIAAEAALAAVAWLGIRRVPYQRALSTMLLAVGLGWFLLRLKN